MRAHFFRKTDNYIRLTSLKIYTSVTVLTHLIYLHGTPICYYCTRQPVTFNDYNQVIFSNKVCRGQLHHGQLTVNIKKTHQQTTIETMRRTMHSRGNILVMADDNLIDTLKLKRQSTKMTRMNNSISTSSQK